MADNTTPREFLSYPNQGDESWYSEDAEGQGLADWLAAIELFGVPTYATFGDLPAAGDPETNGEQRQFAAVVGDRTVYRTDGSSWVPWFGAGTGSRPLPGTSHFEEVATDDLVDGAGVSHTEQLADLGQVFLQSYAKTVGGGSITNNSGVVEVRVPGAASSTDESRLYSQILEFDPSVSRRVRVNLSSVTIDNNSAARTHFGVSDAPDGTGVPGNDFIFAQVRGDGNIFAQLSQDGTNSNSNITKSNSYVSSLNYVEFRWDGSSLTVEVDDGSTTETVSHSSNYPSGETLHLKISARDADSSNARNADFDVDSVVFDQ